MQNPFQVGNAIPASAFINRRREVRRLAGCIANGGQSCALVGEPRSGKTSLLNYLMCAENRERLYAEKAASLHFQFLDFQSLGTQFDAASFWARALSPLEELVKAQSDLQPAWRTCRLEDYGTFVLERFFAQLQKGGQRLVLLLDEFDTLLHHPVLNQSEFYGGLRSLASRFESLALVIACRQSLSEMNRATQEFSRTGSPYFNFLQEINLGAFKEKDALELLESAQARFTKEDKTYILRLAGGHPYLLQVAGTALWSAYEDGEENLTQCYEQTGMEVYQQAAPTLKDSWRLWPAEMKKAFTIVALDNLPALLGERRQYDLEALLEELPDYAPELRTLELLGYLKPGQVGQTQSGYLIQAEVMLWWLVEELLQALRRQDDLGQWLQAEGWEGLLKRGQKDALVKTVRAAGGFLKSGLETLIKSAAEGLGKAASGSTLS